MHGLTIADADSALITLKRVNYYRLSAYGIGLTQKDDKEKYIKGLSLEHIYNLYEFDSLFRNILIRVIEQLEIQLRTQISYHLALKYGPEGYTERSNFADKRTKDGASVYEMILENFRKECLRQRRAPFVKHHVDNYDGHFPIWVAVELFTFGNLSSLFSIMLPEDRKKIAALYDTEPKYLRSWILSLVELRNICAHYGRLYNVPLKQAPHLYKEHKKYGAGDINKVFPALLTIKRMLDDDERWHDFYRQLEVLLERYGAVVRLPFMGFPAEWQSVLAG